MKLSQTPKLLAILLVLASAGCSSIDTGGIASTLREGAETYRDLKDEDEKKDDDKDDRKDDDKSTREDTAASSSSDTKTVDGRPDTINIEDQTYIRRGGSQTSSSGFWYGNQWYERTSEKHTGARYVPGNASQGNGFWQNSKYWVPATEGSTSTASPRVINIQGQSYVSSGSERTTSSGFSYNGLWYARANDNQDGVEFREGKPSDGNGFWQNSKYWVPK